MNRYPDLPQAAIDGDDGVVVRGTGRVDWVSEMLSDDGRGTVNKHVIAGLSHIDLAVPSDITETHRMVALDLRPIILRAQEGAQVGDKVEVTAVIAPRCVEVDHSYNGVTTPYFFLPFFDIDGDQSLFPSFMAPFGYKQLDKDGNAHYTCHIVQSVSYNGEPQG